MKFADGIALFSKKNQRHANQFSDFRSRPICLWSRGFANDGRTGDQHDAFSIATWLSRADRDGRLAALLNPDLSPPERTLAQVEGWILGVPGGEAAC